MLRPCTVEQLALAHSFGFSAVIKANEMAYPAKSASMNIRIDDNCIDLFEDHSTWYVAYKVDTNIDQTSLVEYLQGV